MWNNLEIAWKAAFELGWESLKCGSIPIGAVIIDETGNIISQGRNRIYESFLFRFSRKTVLLP